MRKLCLILFCILFPLYVFAENIPQPQGWVNDFAGVLSPDYLEKLNSLLSELEEKTTAEVAVVTVKSIAPYDEKEYARLLFDNWKPGKKGKDNGVLLFLAVKERRWRIETGYGVEGILPDGISGDIGRNYMVPYFKQGDYGQGLYQGAVKICALLSGGKIQRAGPENTNTESPPAGFLILIIIVIIIINLFRITGGFYGGGYREGYSGGYGGGGYGGGGFGGGGFGGFGGGGGGGGGAGGGF